MYHHYTIMFKKIIKVDHKMQGCIIFGQIGLGHFFGKIDNSYFCQSIVPHHRKIFKLKKVLRNIRFCNFRPNWDQIAGFFLLRKRIRKSCPLAKNLLILPPTSRKNPPTKFLSPPTKCQFPCFNPIKASFLAFQLLLFLLSF